MYFYFVGAIKVEVYGAYLYTEKYISRVYVFIYDEIIVLKIKRFIYSGEIVCIEEEHNKSMLDYLLKSCFLDLVPVRKFKRYYNQA